MGIKEKFEERIKKKEQEIQEYEAKIREARAYIQAIQDTIKFLPKEDVSGISAEKTIRPGSTVAKTLAFLRKAGKPLYITDILKGIGKTTSKKDRISLSGSLGWYVRRNEVFTRPAPNTFGLKEMEEILKEEPPDDFGLSKEENIKEE